MKCRVMGKTVDVPDERIRLIVQAEDTGKGAGDGGATHERPQGNDVKSGGRTSQPTNLPGWPKPTDKWNASYAQFLELEKQAGRIKHWWFEGFSIYLPGKVKYTPDFLIQYPDGLERPLHFVEVKGWSRNLRDGITRYKIAASLFPCFTWSMVKRERGGWVDY